MRTTGGPSGGGNIFDVTGNGLASAKAVHFGAKAATNILVLSPYAIAAVAPAGTGTGDVTVTTAGGTSAAGDADKYSYVVPQSTPSSPTITSITPHNGPLTGGTDVTIDGTNLDGAYAVSFGATAAPTVNDVSATEVKAFAPAAQFASRVDISVTTSAGTSVPSAADLFTYGSPPPPTPTSVAVSASPNPVLTGRQLTLKATVTPTDGGGMVSFTSDGSAIVGCDSLPLALQGSVYKARCSTTLLGARAHTIGAAYSGDASYASSTGSTTLRVAAPKADGLITVPPSTKFVGRNIFSATAKNETKSVVVAPGKSVSFEIKIKNVSPATASYRVQGGNSGSGFTAVYYRGTRGTTNITKRVNAGTYSTGLLAHDSAVYLRLKVTVSKTAKVNSTKKFLIAFRGPTRTTVLDAVKGIVTAK
jgi:hypothetical protein